MTPEEAILLVREKFPFEEYMDATGYDAHRNIADTVSRYLRSGDKVLDFGSGPCDKTAVVSLLGFRCSALDDLQDEWHQVEGARDKIVAFAGECGIDFNLKRDDTLPFEKGSFDMVMMHDVLEHLHVSPRDLLIDLLELVRPEGYFFATVPNAVNIRKRIHVIFGKTNLPPFREYYWYPGPWRGHVREYTKDDLVKLSEYLELDVAELRGCHHMLQKVPRAARLAYVGLSAAFTGWRDSWLLVAKKRPNWGPRKSCTQLLSEEPPERPRRLAREPRINPGRDRALVARRGSWLGAGVPSDSSGRPRTPNR
ncbi:MAG: class I SAM-dependent methyltransferase [Pseudonocardiaceae bacterium]